MWHSTYHRKWHNEYYPSICVLPSFNKYFKSIFLIQHCYRNMISKSFKCIWHNSPLLSTIKMIINYPMISSTSLELSKGWHKSLRVHITIHGHSPRVDINENQLSKPYVHQSKPTVQHPCLFSLIFTTFYLNYIELIVGRWLNPRLKTFFLSIGYEHVFVGFVGRIIIWSISLKIISIKKKTSCLILELFDTLIFDNIKMLRFGLNSWGLFLLIISRLFQETYSDKDQTLVWIYV